MTHARLLRCASAIIALGALLVATAQAAPFRLVMDVNSGPATGADSFLLSDGEKLFFWGYDGISGSAGQPWVSDGTTAGTQKVGDIVGGGGAFFGNQPRFAHQGVVYFAFYDAFAGDQLWRSDGTMPGTFALTATVGGIDTSLLRLTPIGGVLLFEDGNGTSGYTLASTDGTVAGTHALVAGLVTSSPAAILHGRAIFIGSGPGVLGLIVSDGTAAGTSIFAVPGLGSFPLDKSIVAVNDTAYFAAADATHGTELWKTDGTPSGTAMVRDIYVGGSSFPAQLTRVDDRLFFTATTPGAGQELWASDGTPGGTVLVKDTHLGVVGRAFAAYAARRDALLRRE